MRQEFQADIPPQQEATLGTEFQKIKEFLFEDGKIIGFLRFFCNKLGEFSIRNNIYTKNNAAKKDPGPFVIGRTETCEYSLRKKTCECDNPYYINKVQDFDKYVQRKDERDSIESESLDNSAKPIAKKAIEVLSNEELLEKRKAYVEIIKQDLIGLNKRHQYKSSNVSYIRVLSERVALIRHLKTPEEVTHF